MAGLSINTNLSSLSAQKSLDRTNRALDTSLQRLASGRRINSARDDVAGLAISNRLQAQIRSLGVAERNINDGISVAQIAEGALSSVSDILFRINDLAIQAGSDALDAIDKENIQKEVAQQLAEIDRIAAVTRFSGRKLFDNGGSFGLSDDRDAIIDGLRNAWLRQSEIMIEEHYGITGDGSELKIFIDDTIASAAAYVSGTLSGGVGLVNNQELHIDLSEFPENPPNGGNSPYYSDRIIAHEMVHAVMGRNVNFATAAIPTWFQEGLAEFIVGADERTAVDLAAAGGNTDTVVAAINGAWTGTSLQYSSAYVAVRYLHDVIKTNGGEGIREVIDHLKADITNNTLDTAIQALNAEGKTGGLFGTLPGFTANFTAAAGDGSTFLGAMDLANADTGAIGGFDADGGEVKTAENVVADVVEYHDDVLQNFREVWPDNTDTVFASSNMLALQVGIYQGETIDMTIKGMSTSALGLDEANVATNHGKVISRVNVAIDHISKVRAELGAIQNRLESSVNSTINTANNLEASNSRILDADFAVETAALTKSQILSTAGNSVLVQANASKQIILSLLS